MAANHLRIRLRYLTGDGKAIPETTQMGERRRHPNHLFMLSGSEMSECRIVGTPVYDSASSR